VIPNAPDYGSGVRSEALEVSGSGLRGNSMAQLQSTQPCGTKLPEHYAVSEVLRQSAATTWQVLPASGFSGVLASRGA
jgi:hypothetical protein